MRLGYSKMNEINTISNNPFPQRSRSKKEYAFLDQEVEHKLYRKKSQKPNQQSQPTKDDDDDDDDDDEDNDKDKSKKDEIRGEEGGERKLGGSLRRNFSVSAAQTGQKNRGIERQSSTRSFQGAIKRAFSMSIRRSSSVNNSERYCRIYDQSSTLDHDDHGDYDDQNDFGNRNDDEEEDEDEDDDDDGSSNNESMKSRSMGKMKNKKKKNQQNNSNNNEKKQNVGSKLLRACKRLFSR